MADITKLLSLIETYGIGVRAGMITPQVEDEEYFRNVLEIPAMSGATKSNWAKTNGVKSPITLVQAGAPASPFNAPAPTGDETDMEKDQ